MQRREFMKIFGLAGIATALSFLATKALDTPTLEDTGCAGPACNKEAAQTFYFEPMEIVITNPDGSTVNHLWDGNIKGIERIGNVAE